MEVLLKISSSAWRVAMQGKTAARNRVSQKCFYSSPKKFQCAAATRRTPCVTGTPRTISKLRVSSMRVHMRRPRAPILISVHDALATLAFLLCAPT